MAHHRILVLAALLLGACTSHNTKVERTWERFERQQHEVLARAQSASSAGAAAGIDTVSPANNPVARVLDITTFASLAYMTADLEGLERAVRELENCDRELGGS